VKILITGGAGFIGSHLADRRLRRGDRVVVLDDFNDFYDPAVKRANVAAHRGDPAYRLVEGDIRDRTLVARLFAEERFDAVLHLAARAGVRPSLAEPVLYEQVNCIGTLHLLEAAVAIRCNNLPTLSYKLDRLLADPARFSSMHANAKRMGRPNAATEIVGQLIASF